MHPAGNSRSEGIVAWRVEQQPAAQHLKGAVFLGRQGGFSRGNFAELNLSDAVGDSSSAVQQNWAKVKRTFPEVRHWVRMRQVHGTTVQVWDELSVGHNAAECDATVTAVAGAALCVLTADCVPALLASSDGRVVAAVHAGWRGTAGLLVSKVVHVLCQRFRVTPQALWVALGPAIGPCCYEVGDDVATAFATAGLGAAVRRTGSTSYRVDLRFANRVALSAAGVPTAQIVDVGECTACRKEHFFSHRRQQGLAGRQLSFIVCGENALQLCAA